MGDPTLQTMTPGPHQNRETHPMAHYQFSSEELMALRQCNSESFFQRSLPMGTGMGLAMYAAIKKGFLSPNQRFGAVPKVVVSVIIGYFLGRLSYQRKCAEKLMQIPNSKLGEILRQRKKGSIYDTFTPDQGLGAGMALAPFTAPNQDFYTDEGLGGHRSGSLDLDTERPLNAGLDDINRLTLDSPAIVYEDNLPTEPPKQAVTYDELRKRNREEYLKKTQSSYNRPLPADAPQAVRVEDKPAPEMERPPGSKNRYGDVWTQ